MVGKIQVVKGRIKEAAGALTGNERLRVAGRLDRASGKAKADAHRAVTEVKLAAHTAVGKAKQAGRTAVDKAKAAAKKLRD